MIISIRIIIIGDESIVHMTDFSIEANWCVFIRVWRGRNTTL